MTRRSFSQFIEDIRWAMNAQRARAMRRELLFSRRLRFDESLRPILKDGARIAYPDALYHITIDDVCRAYAEAKLR